MELDNVLLHDNSLLVLSFDSSSDLMEITRCTNRSMTNITMLILALLVVVVWIWSALLHLSLTMSLPDSLCDFSTSLRLHPVHIMI